MKPSLQHGFPVSAQLQSWEKPDEVTLLYTGVLAVTLNSAVEIGWGVPSSEFAGTVLMEFLLGRVITSPHFAPEDGRRLGR